MNTPEELKALVDPVVQKLSKEIGGGTVIVMVSGLQPSGSESLYVGYSGPLLSVRGLREAGGEALQNLVMFNVTAPAKKE
jgi:hypothetical protein